MRSLSQKCVNIALQVKDAAHTVVASNDDGGIAEAIERFLL